jgi:hypothetical protein
MPVDHPFSPKFASDILPWPGRFDWLAAFIIAAAVFTLEINIAIAIGRAQSLAYDGLGYATHARLKYVQLGTLFHAPERYVGGFLNYIAPLWSAFFVLTYGLVGVGEVQTYVVWFWPVFLLLLLVVWLVRVIADRTAAVLLAAMTAILPLSSPSLALAIDYELGRDWIGYMQANLADVRPDPLAHAFMAWSVVPLLLHGREAKWTTFAATAVAAAASVLTKGTTGPLAIGCWVIASLYTAWLQRDRWRRVAGAIVFSGVVLVLLLTPWMAAGGLRQVLNYIRDAYLWKPFYQQSATEAGLHHFGFWELLSAIGLFLPWPVVGLMAAVIAPVIVSGGQRDSRSRRLLLGVGLVTAGILFVLWVQSLRNFFISLPLVYMMWLAFVISAAVLWQRYGIRPFVRIVTSVFVILGVSAAASTGLAGAVSWPQDDLDRLLRGRQLIREIAGHIRVHITNRDTFAGLVLASGWPMILQFHMTEGAAGYPAALRISPLDGPAIAETHQARQRFIDDLESKAKLIITFKDPPSALYQKARMSDFFLPHFNALYEYLNSDRSRYRPVREYVFPPPGRLFFPPAAGTVVMYLRDDVPSRF